MKAVVGLAFDASLERVLLIQKERPDWQKGLLNGVGGKVEAGELFEEAMRREFREETGIDHDRWEKFAALVADGVEIEVFRTILDIDAAYQTTDEELIRLPTNEVTQRENLMHNLKWLIPMAMYDHPRHPVVFPISFLPNTYRFQ